MRLSAHIICSCVHAIHLYLKKFNMVNEERNQLRKTLRQQRRQLTAHNQHQHAHAMARLLCRQPAFRNARRIAFYLAEDGEIDPCYIIEKAWQYKKDVYLPVLPPTGKSLVFALYQPDTL